ncbi:hypothetical protein [Streptomyces harbinensis]|uniref:Phosphotransferase enzyme family protein n=1 Tax=Streptomyces harbinensis TaxID=1176198 RepID=A0A1I6WBE2_9ACTN|nr:hypothetical protein [Streptomyces harbinensis]SFT23323.1 hypothetical protein SAMN05444716_11721 [Streptomyces harbinensis]
MYSPPADPATEQAMRSALHAAARALDATVTGPPAWGWHGRTLSHRAEHPRHGACWLRLACAPAGKQGGKIWEGTAEAARAFDGRVTKPRLHAVHDHDTDGAAYRAELTQYIASPTVAADPVIRHPIDVPDTWWKTLRTDLDTIAATPTTRVAVRDEWIARTVPTVTGHPAPRVTAWTTAHGDLHLANLTSDGTLLDWEGWGRAPAGYDAALLLGYALLQPALAARIRREFDDLLDTAAGRAAQLVVAAELLQSVGRGDHPDLEAPLREWAAAVA